MESRVGGCVWLHGSMKQARCYGKKAELCRSEGKRMGIDRQCFALKRNSSRNLQYCPLWHRTLYFRQTHENRVKAIRWKNTVYDLRSVQSVCSGIINNWRVRRHAKLIRFDYGMKLTRDITLLLDRGFLYIYGKFESAEIRTIYVICKNV